MVLIYPMSTRNKKVIWVIYYIHFIFKSVSLHHVSACGFHVNGQNVEVSKCTMHLGYSISSGDRTEIVKYAKRSCKSIIDHYFISDANLYLNRTKYIHVNKHFLSVNISTQLLSHGLIKRENTANILLL